MAAKGHTSSAWMMPWVARYASANTSNALPRSPSVGSAAIRRSSSWNVRRLSNSPDSTKRRASRCRGPSITLPICAIPGPWGGVVNAEYPHRRLQQFPHSPVPLGLRFTPPPPTHGRPALVKEDQLISLIFRLSRIRSRNKTALGDGPPPKGRFLRSQIRAGIPAPPVLPQGTPDQPTYTLSPRHNVCQGDSRSLNSGNQVSGVGGIRRGPRGLARRGGLERLYSCNVPDYGLLVSWVVENKKCHITYGKKKVTNLMRVGRAPAVTRLISPLCCHFHQG